MSESNKFIAIQVQVVDVDVRGWTCSKGLPTFFLHPNVQGLAEVTEETLRPIVEKIVGPRGPRSEIHFTWCEAD